MPATYTAFCDAVKGIPVRPPCPAPDTFSLPTSAGRWVRLDLGQQQVRAASWNPAWGPFLGTLVRLP
ncbi:hypothetical protein HaLaN_20572 [Haematococcus lacustris]|uniref:Uncharacterized protein n=1 Tax=Haematococcus lacustris TaxID=44745 RepID=A0A699ZWH1_HAELA|nr:hypothetical protein HaLaN_20572 [Haematococcus lacustris]